VLPRPCVRLRARGRISRAGLADEPASMPLLLQTLRSIDEGDETMRTSDLFVERKVEKKGKINKKREKSEEDLTFFPFFYMYIYLFILRHLRRCIVFLSFF
jgi:hypothetical protein